jgi:predicted choloylglycine hydrolase
MESILSDEEKFIDYVNFNIINNEKKIRVTLEHNNDDELRTSYLIKWLYKYCDIPIFTKRIHVDSDCKYPHSHPKITIDTKSNNNIIEIIEILIHEQFHWYEAKYGTIESYKYIQKKYEKQFQVLKDEFYDDLRNFSEHIIVMWNTTNVIKEILNEKTFIYLKTHIKRPYVKTQQFIYDKFDEIYRCLEKFDLIYDIEKYGKSIIRQHFHGSFYNIGFQIGQIYLKNGKNVDIQIDETLPKQLEIYKQHFPEKLEMVKGMSDGGQYNLTKLQQYYLCAPFAGNAQCSIFGKIIDNNIIIGRNYDWATSTKRKFQVFDVEPDKGYKYIGITDLAIDNIYFEPHHWSFFTEDAYNEHGLYIGMFYAFHDKNSFGIQCDDMLDLVALKCKNVPECISLFKTIPINEPKTYFICDKYGEMIIIEHLSGLKFEIVKPQDGILIHTNHFISSGLKGKDSKIYKESIDRYNAIKSELKDIQTIADIDKLMSTKPIFVDTKYSATIWRVLYNIQKEQFIIKAI